MSSPTVFLTGAAAGIGRATALLFAAQGYRVGAYDIDEVGLGRLAAEIDAAGGQVRTGVLDVTNDTHWQQRLAEFHEAHGRLDILINNAGILRAGPFESIDLRTHRAIVDVNLDGVIAGSHHAFPYLRDTAGAQLVNLCSASAIYGQPELASYGATKSAVKSLTEALDLEWARHDIRVLAIWPLFVATGMVDGVQTGTTRSLGIRLTAEDVAQGIWDATRNRPRLPRVHYAIGRQAKLLALTAKLSPGWAVRTANKYFSGS
ncbi:SDR family oxidoreductase [Nocardia farcinica]|uniref:3-alpha-(Or 20-beta)-hydroxysteroid dehydrogenase n=1 Tax=Nocardia farcinica TaxID=37329 RepID=A0A0H5P249_NOCFR|nr:MULTISPECIES: SDR family oxidoreductase [Nocardia]AXK87280.1 SDR family oxidoreductase [Nocardia farcinica]MBA4857838.1 SDR family oxidoreductase [Nocardia farcinica]MBC9819036.1 SDR family oxidoreductase [Nocardia farcinica]MBF6068999.1 SDR family oxidoreductase [Nocardia farcinica]MBF6186684.1 SDR family oxidoreductase [Nocardia farcinica]